ncbi:MAG: mannose-1-phosphate guanylyltransferase [Phycisphaerales bacterium]|nr:MAG: mannose-1-phosphate guanylyltransferase [Phycisphaerales bacterium]
MDQHRYAMIMAGGSGTRLWPMSRSHQPKQLLKLLTGPDARQPRSLIELAADRIEGLVPPAHRLVCTLERYRPQVAQVLPTLGSDQIIGEPIGRDTVNAIGLTAAVLARRDPQAAFCVLTADHVIEPVGRFQRLVALGFDLVGQHPRTLVTFSIEPTHPATGYGYVRRGQPIEGTDGLGYRVERFVEKPDHSTAQAYLDEGRYGWNSGMFVWRAATFLDCLRCFLPQAYDGLMAIADAWDGPDRAGVLERIYPTLPKTSVDYAVMEPATTSAASSVPGGPVDVATIRMDVAWLDVGSWPSYAETLRPDDAGNRQASLEADASAILCDSRDNLVVNAHRGHTIALLGCRGLVVVHTPQATLVMPADHAERLKDLHARLPEALR